MDNKLLEFRQSPLFYLPLKGTNCCQDLNGHRFIIVYRWVKTGNIRIDPSVTSHTNRSEGIVEVFIESRQYLIWFQRDTI